MALRAWRPALRICLLGLVGRQAHCRRAGGQRSARCGAAVGGIRLAGGLSRSAALAQLKADILGRPVTVMADAELTTIGLAAIGATHLGAFETIAAAAGALARDAATYRPGLDAGAANALYARYLRGAGLSISLVPGTGSDTSGQTSGA